MLPYAQTAYEAPTRAVRTPRAAEYDVIARVTHRLISTSAQRQINFPAFIEALFQNEQLWSTLASDVASPMNGLPAALRSKLFYLYRFTHEHSQKVRNSGANPEVLIEINKAVLRGLRGAGESQ